jgi:hypothetical protein
VLKRWITAVLALAAHPATGNWYGRFFGAPFSLTYFTTS